MNSSSARNGPAFGESADDFQKRFLRRWVRFVGIDCVSEINIAPTLVPAASRSSATVGKGSGVHTGPTEAHANGLALEQIVGIEGLRAFVQEAENRWVHRERTVCIESQIAERLVCKLKARKPAARHTPARRSSRRPKRMLHGAGAAKIVPL